MTATVDPMSQDITECDNEVPMISDWLARMWGVRPGVSSPTSSRDRVHPSCLASAGWLTALWGFSI